MITKFYQVTEDTLNNKQFESGAVYVTTDTRRIYADPVEGGSRTLISGDPIVISTEAERENILSPISNKIYIALDSLKMYIYIDGVWNSLVQDGRTPVKGTDYWTDEDKAEIKAYVDEAILGGVW